MRKSHQGAVQSDALVLFGVTGDLAHKKISPALYAMAKHGALTVPIIGVASSNWSLEQLRARVKDSVAQSGEVDNPAALEHLLSLIGYVSGDYNDSRTFAALKKALGAARRPAHYLAIPPSLFTTVIEGLAAAGLTDGARVVVEKPFGRDLESAQALNRAAALVGSDGSIDWACCPCFDSGACFAALPGTPEHGRWLIAPVRIGNAASKQFQLDVYGEVMDTLHLTHRALINTARPTAIARTP